MKAIKLSKKSKNNSDYYAFVDDDDYERLSKHTWNAHFYDDDIVYATTNIKGKMVSMSRYIMDAQKGTHVDHINHDTLDNRKENLRICTPSQNIWNSRKRKYSSSIWKGVSLNKRSMKWIASICVKGKRISLGSFEYERDAAKAYDKAAILYFGEYAMLNEGMYDLRNYKPCIEDLEDFK